MSLIDLFIFTMPKLFRKQIKKNNPSVYTRKYIKIQFLKIKINKIDFVSIIL